MVEVKDQPWLLNPDGSCQLDADGKKIRNPNNEGYIGPPMPTRTFQFSSKFDRCCWHLRAMMDHSGGSFRRLDGSSDRATDHPAGE